MREIKFRGKRVDNGEWIYGFLITTHTKISDIISPNLHNWEDIHEVLIIPPLVKQYMSTESIKWDILELDHENIHVVIPETVGQFTGWLDENGEEFYEGDIVDYREWCADAQSWSRQRDVVEYIDDEMAFRGAGCTMPTEGIYYRKIGNIHDNPELLDRINDC